MDQKLIISITIAAFIGLMFLIRFFSANSSAQRELNRYLNKQLTDEEIGRAYERYIGYLYESEGYDVVYNGAVNGVDDMGRDLIVRAFDEVLIIQAKCWAKFKTIPEAHIFQLYGTAAHFEKTAKKTREKIKPLFYTSAKYSDVAKEVADVLDVELIHLNLKRTYPMIKCCKSEKGTMTYHMPFDLDYDTIKINPFKGDSFVSSVNEAVQKGFKRAS